MKLFTAQISLGKYVSTQCDVPVVDVTVKSGNKAFAPTWDFLMEYKKSAQDAEAERIYTEKFYNAMRASFRANRDEWLTLLNLPEVCLLCYCTAGKFCHRILLVDIIRKQCGKWNIPFEYGGELVKPR